MKLVVAVIDPAKLDAVKEKVHSLGVSGMTVTQAQGFGHQHGRTYTFRDKEYEAEFVAKLKVEILADDAESDAILEAVIEAAHTGETGDGKVWVLAVEKVARVSTDERGAKAL
jgi:nitrogen regulatory protein PII